MLAILAIALGGALGAVSRYGVSFAVATGLGSAMTPLATLAVNVVGSGLMGVAYAMLGLSFPVSDPVRGFIMVGFLGAMTTFSTFSLDIIALIDRGHPWLAMGYAAGSVIGSVLSFVVAVSVLRMIQ